MWLLLFGISSDIQNKMIPARGWRHNEWMDIIIVFMAMMMTGEGGRRDDVDDRTTRHFTGVHKY